MSRARSTTRSRTGSPDKGEQPLPSGSSSSGGVLRTSTTTTGSRKRTRGQVQDGRQARQDKDEDEDDGIESPGLLKKTRRRGREAELEAGEGSQPKRVPAIAGPMQNHMGTSSPLVEPRHAKRSSTDLSETRVNGRVTVNGQATHEERAPLGMYHANGTTPDGNHVVNDVQTTRTIPAFASRCQTARKDTTTARAVPVTVYQLKEGPRPALRKVTVATTAGLQPLPIVMNPPDSGAEQSEDMTQLHSALKPTPTFRQGLHCNVSDGARSIDPLPRRKAARLILSTLIPLILIALLVPLVQRYPQLGRAGTYSSIIKRHSRGLSLDQSDYHSKTHASVKRMQAKLGVVNDLADSNSHALLVLAGQTESFNARLGASESRMERLGHDLGGLREEISANIKTLQSAEESAIVKLQQFLQTELKNDRTRQDEASDKLKAELRDIVGRMESKMISTPSLGQRKSLLQQGAVIIPHWTSRTKPIESQNWSTWALSFVHPALSARAAPPIAAISSSGVKWCFSGPSGSLGIRLPAPQSIRTVHVPTDPRQSHSPRSFELWGLARNLDGKTGLESIVAWTGSDASITDVSTDAKEYQELKLMVLDNQGGSSTCLGGIAIL